MTQDLAQDEVERNRNSNKPVAKTVSCKQLYNLKKSPSQAMSQ